MGDYPMNKYEQYDNYGNYHEYDNDGYIDYYDTNHNITDNGSNVSDEAVLYLAGFMCFTLLATHCSVTLCGMWDNRERDRYSYLEDIRIRNNINERVERRRNILKEIKIKEYDESLLIHDSECCICLDKFEDGEKISTLKCNHCFHEECIDNWLQKNLTCPLCRLSL